ncbi:DUF3108 domain-containing protein [Balneolales bacterium ANBcel1]|nr:DUF3108 domain-containing protein [Balneolales bacterium ANBcel1]
MPRPLSIVVALGVAGLFFIASGIGGSIAMGNNHTESTGAGPPSMEVLEHLNERFTYEVRYGFLRLGNVHVYVERDTVYRDTPVRHLVTEMVSNRRLPLVGYREVHYHSYIAFNDSVPYGVRFWQNSLHHDMMERYLYDYDYEQGRVYSFEEGEPVDTLDLDRPSDSGPAIMFYARLFAGTDSNRTYPIYIDHEASEIEMAFTSRKEPYESKAFPDEAISAYYMEGNADFEGPFGFSGEFEAYFRDDELRIPLEARVSIWLGSVRVRLVEYERY